MDERQRLDLSVITAVIVIITIVVVSAILLLAAFFFSKPLPDGLMALLSGVSMAAIGLPAAFSFRSTLRKRDANGKDTNGT